MLRPLINLFLHRLPPSRLFALCGALWRSAAVEVRRGACICGGGRVYGSDALIANPTF